MAPYYPVYLDVKERCCVIVGGGQIAEGKIAALLECGAQIRMISPEVTDEVQDMADTGALRLEKREYRDGDLEGAFIAIAATDDTSLSRRIAKEAGERNVPLNVADVTHLCTFIAPAVVRRGEVTAAISTGGLSPALARKLRVELQASRPWITRTWRRCFQRCGWSCARRERRWMPTIGNPASTGIYWRSTTKTATRPRRP